MKYNERGEELPDSTPIEMPLRFKRPPTLQEQIKLMVRRELSESARDQGFESFEEADDFGDDDEEPLPFSQYEVKDMLPEVRIAKEDASKLDKKKDKEDDDSTPEVKADTKEKSHGRSEDGKGGERADRGVSSGDGEKSGSKGK